MGPALTAACRALAVLYRAYYGTLRMDGLLREGTCRVEEWPFGDEIFALSERDVLALAGIMAGRRFTVLVAHGADGDWASTMLETLGCTIVRGSSLRGGTAAVGRVLAELSARRTPAGIVVDGPLGPAGQPRAGVLAWSARTGRPIRALAAAARRAFVFRGTWSHLYLPLPFTRLAVACDDAWRVSPELGRDARNRSLAELAARLEWARATASAGVRRRRSQLARERTRLTPPASAR
jgi:lysophospholipid acyltransferase (LPLAT)-like uncharacterized protein